MISNYNSWLVGTHIIAVTALAASIRISCSFSYYIFQINWGCISYKFKCNYLLDRNIFYTFQMRAHTLCEAVNQLKRYAQFTKW